MKYLLLGVLAGILPGLGLLILASVRWGSLSGHGANVVYWLCFAALVSSISTTASTRWPRVAPTVAAINMGLVSLLAVAVATYLAR